MNQPCKRDKHMDKYGNSTDIWVTAPGYCWTQYRTQYRMQYRMQYGHQYGDSTETVRLFFGWYCSPPSGPFWFIIAPPMCLHVGGS